MNVQKLSMWFVPVALCVGLSGCVPQKQTYIQPSMPTAPEWHAGVSESASHADEDAPHADQLTWKEYYTDAKLQRVIELSLANNRDLRVAALNVEKARAEYRLQRASQFPEIDAAVGTSTTHTPGSVMSNMLGSSGDVKSSTYTTYSAEAEVSSWELDFFGRLRQLTRQQQELYLATEQGRTNTQMSLIASVAGQYLNVASDRDALRLANNTLDNQNSVYELIRQSRDHGIKSDLDVSEARSQVESAKADVAKYLKQLNADENELNVLVGTSVPAELLSASLGSNRFMTDVSAGLPSEVLLRRPDILQAEHNLKSSYANIAAARAAYFPKITLTSTGGTSSGALKDLFGAGTAAWEFVPQVSLPIFDAGTRKANYRIAQVERDTYIADYEKSIQTAFQEVSDALNARARLLEQEKAIEAEVNSLQQTYMLTDARYRSGTDSYKDVLDAQRSLYSGQQTLISTRSQRLSNLVTLYKVLGGGAR